MASKKELIKRIEILERQVKNIKNPSLLTDSERRADEQERRMFIYDTTEYLRKQLDELSHVVSLWRNIFYTSGIVTDCGADRTEFQWQQMPEDKLHRYPHFKINRVMIERDSVGDKD